MTMDSKSCEISIQKPEQSQSVVMLLLQFRIKHYFFLMKSFLMQYKQGLILLLALLAPTIAGLNYIFTKPFFVFITAHHPAKASSCAFLIYFLYAIWIIIQKPAIQSRSAESYLATLPLSKEANRMIDLLMLCVANNIFLILLIAVMASILFSDQFNLNYFLSAVFLTISIFSIEKNMLCKSYLGCFMTIAVSGAYCFVRPVFNNPVFSIISLFLIIFVCCTFLWDIRFVKSRGIQFFSVRRRSLLLRTALLLRVARTQSITRLCLTCFVFILGFVLSFFTKLSFYPFAMIAVIFGIAAFIASGIFVYFEKEKRKYKPYLNSFPVSKTQWVFKDILYAISVFIAFNLIFFTAMAYHFSIHYSWFFVFECYQVFLLTMLYKIRTYFDVFGTVLSSVITVAWIYFFILLKGFL